MKINDILIMDPLFKNKMNLSHEPLNGGFSNETHVVTCDEIKYVVKINFAQNKFLNLTRHTEMKAQEKAAQLGIAPKVLSDINNEEYSISEFLNGHLITSDEINNKDNIIKFASIIKKIHSITEVDRKSSIFDLIDGYVTGIEEFKVKIPEGYYDVLKKTEMIRTKRSKDNTNNMKYCHNDLLNCNLLYNKGKIGVIDWELSGIGDLYMDLATIPYQMNFSEENEKLLLKTYFDYYEDEMLMNLRDLRYIGIVRELVWGLFFEGMNMKSMNHNLNYYEAACYAMERLKGGFLSM